MRAEVDYQDVTIADGQSLSGAANLGGMTLCGVIVPSGWDTAALTFQGSYDGINYFNLGYEGTEVSYAAVAASVWTIVPPQKFYGIPYVKVRSGTSGTAVNQSGAVNVTLVSRPV